MQDIDFDEIDRAVSSVTNKDTEVIAPPVVTPLSNAIAVNVVKNTPPDEPKAPSVSSPVTSPAARRSSGRFMDVVHPSSDMRSQQITPQVKKVETPLVPQIKPVESAAFHWPDPVDASTSETDEPLISEVPTELEDTTPLESPFLSDTKVVKRPLGAFSSNGPESDLPLLEDFPAPKAVETPAEPKVEVPVEETLLVEAYSEGEEAPELLAAEAKDVVSEEAPTGPTSITQQYQEKPSSAEQSSGSIYDTEAYHQPLTHAVQKRPSVLIVIWIAALIIVGGGIGAAIYFIFLPMLG